MTAARGLTGMSLAQPKVAGPSPTPSRTEEGSR